MSQRSNSERFGTPEAPSPPPNSGTDLFAFVNPTEFVELPSAGAFYPEKHPFHNLKMVEIKHMTAKEEDILTSETLLRKGLAIDRLLKSVILDKTVDVDTLLVGDKNAILVAARITGFGPFYDISAACPSCEQKSETTVNLSELEIKDVDLSEVKQTEDNHYSVLLPITGVTIQFRLLTSKDETKISKIVESRKKKNQIESLGSLVLESIIYSANGITDRTQIEKLVGILPLADVRHLRNIYEKVKPDINMTFDLECDGCGLLEKVGMPLTAEFFWPRQ